jgi:hypothetical protein
MARLYLNGAEPLLDDALSLAKVAGAADVYVDLQALARDDPCLAPVPPGIAGRVSRNQGGRGLRAGKYTR